MEKVINSKEKECRDFLNTLPKKYKDIKLMDCILIAIYPDGSEDVVHTSTTNYTLIGQLEVAKHLIFNEIE